MKITQDKYPLLDFITRKQTLSDPPVNAEIDKKVSLNNEKYITDIKSNREIVNSNWFTTLIRTDAFNVSGHFRLQPYGTRKTQRKMVWIKEFQKHGYTKRSRLEVKKELIY